MADNILKAIISADGTEFEKGMNQVKASMQSVTGGITILQNQLDRLQKLASLPGLNLNQLNRIGGLINTTQVELNKLQSVASRISPEFGKITNSTNELEKRIRIATSAEHEFDAILGATPALLAGVENPAAALGQEFLVLSTGIQRARESGQSFGDIASTLASSIFSLQGIITLASAALFAFGKEIFNSGDKTKQSTIELEVYKQKLEELTKVLNDLEGQFKFTDDVRKLNAELAKAGIDAGSLKGLNLSQAFDTKDSKEKISEIDSKVNLIDKDLEKVNTKFSSLNSILENTKKSISDVQERQAKGDATAQLGKVSKDFVLLFKNFGDLKNVTSQALEGLDPIVKTFVTKFQETNKIIEDLSTKRTTLLREKSAEQTTTQIKSIEDQEAIDKKQADIFSKQTDLLAQHLDNIKTTIETAKKIQATGDFAIPKALLIPDSVFVQVTEEGQRLIKQRQDLVDQLTKLDILEQQTGKDQTKAKAAVQLEITKIDLKLNDADFKNATEIIRERLNGLLRVAPISASFDIKLPKEISETQKAEFQKSIETLLQDIKANVPIDITPEFNKDFEDKLKQAIKEVDNAKGFQGLINSMEKVGQLGKISGDETRKAFLAAGASVEEADKAAQNAEKSFDNLHQGLSKGLAESAAILDSTLTPAFQNLFDAILSGEAPLKAFFNSIVKSVDQLISKLIAAAVEAAILSAISGGTSSFGSLFAKLLGFAEGGTPPSNKVSVVGEKGPELFFPGTSGLILSNQKSKALLSESINQATENKSAVYQHKFTTIINNIDNSVKKWFYQTSGGDSSTISNSTSDNKTYSENNSFTETIKNVAQSFSESILTFRKLFSSISTRAQGGPVQYGKPYIVGENKAELFIPGQSGTIIPYVLNPVSNKSVSNSFAPHSFVAPTILNESVSQASQNKSVVYAHKIVDASKWITNETSNSSAKVIKNFEKFVSALSYTLIGGSSESNKLHVTNDSVNKDDHSSANSAVLAESIKQATENKQAVYSHNITTLIDNVHKWFSDSDLSTAINQAVLKNSNSSASDINSVNSFLPKNFFSSKTIDNKTENNYQWLASAIDHIFSESFKNYSSHSDAFSSIIKNHETILEGKQSESLSEKIIKHIISNSETFANNFSQLLKESSSDKSANTVASISNLSDSVNNYSSERASNNTFSSSTVKNFDKLVSSFSYRSTGGEVTHNKPFIVGEKRAELFVPKTDGFIIPFVQNRRFDESLIQTLNVNKTIIPMASGGSASAGSQFLVGEFGPEAFFPKTSSINPQSNGIISTHTQSVFIPKLVIEGNNLAIFFNQMIRNSIATTGKKPF